MFKFLHAADVHLDSPLLGLERYEGAPPVDQMRQATRRALENLVQLALDEQVQFVLIAGDLYDGNWKDYSTGLFFVKQMTRLQQANIPVIAIAGNHDAANKMTKTLRFQAQHAVAMLPADKPKTHRLDNLGVVIHGQGFATEAVTEDLTAGYPPAEPQCFNIGMLHTCANGDPRRKYAPCTKDGLLSKQYQYWALGHRHKSEILHEEPYIVFPGNVQGRDIGETGPKGCMLVTVNDNHSVERPEFRPLDKIRWERCPVDATDAKDADSVLARVAEKLGQLRQASDGRPLAVRVEIKGACTAHNLLHADVEHWTNQIRSLAIEAGGDELWIEKVKFLTVPRNADDLPPSDGPIGELLGIINELRADPIQLEKYKEELGELNRKLPQELKEGPEALCLDDPAWLRGVLDQLGPLLQKRLLSQGTSR